jgi:DeoR family glycerol-3-phosphate regulon repressor
MKQTSRQKEIVNLVAQYGHVNTDDLVEKFKVSPQTIRRDLNELADENKIRRHHGGATTPLTSENTAYTMRKTHQSAEKIKIGEALAKHIHNGASLFMDIGTTSESVARALVKHHKDLRIVTNNMNVALILMANDDFKVILTGGEVRNRDGAIIGETTIDSIRQFRLDFGILGISGIDSDGALLDFDYHEVKVKRAMMENSRKVYLTVDNTKFGRNAMVKLGLITELDRVITDKMPPEAIVKILDENNVPYDICS